MGCKHSSTHTLHGGVSTHSTQTEQNQTHAYRRVGEQTSAMLPSVPSSATARSSSGDPVMVEVRGDDYTHEFPFVESVSMILNENKADGGTMRRDKQATEHKITVNRVYRSSGKAPTNAATVTSGKGHSDPNITADQEAATANAERNVVSEVESSLDEESSCIPIAESGSMILNTNGCNVGRSEAGTLPTTHLAADQYTMSVNRKYRTPGRPSTDTGNGASENRKRGNDTPKVEVEPPPSPEQENRAPKAAGISRYAPTWILPDITDADEGRKTTTDAEVATIPGRYPASPPQLRFMQGQQRIGG